YARTVRYLPLREDLTGRSAGLNAQKQAIEEIGPGEVLVIEARGETTAGTIGDILALRAQVRGAAGIVTDGAIRDSAALARLEIPAYHAAVHPAVLGRRHVPWESGVAVACAGVTIEPGDILVGDADGVVVLPPALAAEVLADAQEQERQEEFIVGRVAQGESIDGLYPLTDRTRPAYQSWLRNQATSSPQPPPTPQASPTPQAPSVPQAPPTPGSLAPEPARCDVEPPITGTLSHRADEPRLSDEAPDTGVTSDAGDAR
ncbi:MAG TPA: hypothetical protein VFW50_33685, partial [Streptosporangiaceae bacterium]|nr:hypothetical protein [Streptosporangiaceae bacterium]